MFNILLAEAASSTDPWAWLVPVGIVVGILSGVLGIWTVLSGWLKPIKVEFRFLNFPSNPGLEDAFEFLGSKNTVEEIMLRLPLDLLATREKRLELSEILAKAIKDRFADKLPPTTGGYSRAITVLKIKNTGRKIQKSVTLSVEQADYFLIKTNNKWVPQIAAGKVSLGDMQVHDEIEVCSWGSTPWNRSGWLKVRSDEGPAVIKYRPWEPHGTFIRRNILYGISIVGGMFLVEWVVALVVEWVAQHWPH